MQFNCHDGFTVEALFPAVVKSASANGDALDVRDFVGKAKVILNAAACTGGVTLDVKIQESADGTTNFTDVAGAAFTQVAATPGIQSIGVNLDATKRFIRAVATLAGSGTATFATDFVANKQVVS